MTMIFCQLLGKTVFGGKNYFRWVGFSTERNRVFHPVGKEWLGMERVGW